MSLKLSPGEEEIFKGHPSWRAILGFYIKGALIAVVIAAIVAGITKIGGDVDKSLVAGAFVVIVVLTIVAGFLKRVSTTYTITTRRLNIRKGIIARKIQETRLERVQNVNYEQSVYQRVMQIGDVDFDTAGEDDSDFTFNGVAQPEQVVEDVDKATEGGAHRTGLGDPPPAPS